MSITLLGLIELPLCLLLVFRPLGLLQLTILGSVFGAAAAMVLGAFGMVPSLPPALLFIGLLLLQLLLGARFPGERRVLWVMFPLLVAAAIGVVGSLILPRIFVGTLLVWPQKSEPPFLPVPLEPSMGNYTQDAYLLLNCLLTGLVALYASGSETRVGRLLKTYWAAGFLVVAIAFWQLANRLAHVPFPQNFFASNPGYAQLFTQTLGGVPRINGSFTEPAALASYLGAVVGATGWMLVRGHRSRAASWLLALALMAMMISTATTGYVTLVLEAVAVALRMVFAGSLTLLTRVASRVAIAGVLVAIAAFAAVTLVPHLGDSASAVLEATLNKQESSSYEDRTSADMDSVALLGPTYGFGVGWGSNRSSSLVPGLLASLGIPGFLALLWFGARVLHLLRQVRAIKMADPDKAVVDAAAGGLFGMLVASCLSAPTISDPLFFVLLGTMIGAAVRIVQRVHKPVVVSAPRTSFAGMAQGVAQGMAQGVAQAGTSKGTGRPGYVPPRGSVS